ncbi:hypothetical protein K6119_09735 [Paracrocinitomix mangrovi]|uniref:hypothetical protein n=1 Tax=Paracrocinitomix mangrovi TaxID=2862509 RepID=UPI001C8D72B6|nr:hypothetical protein [Paracrocinitomix mangrovi]UKN03770.1 hypothetical protein K6119_09735 [Paracrocinitomix mangrovi]
MFERHCFQNVFNQKTMMKMYLLILILFLPIFGISQENLQKFELSGNVQATYFYQGGVENPYEPIPVPLPYIKLNLIRHVKGDSVPQIVKTFQVDSLGNFKVEVAAGHYSFAALGDSLTSERFVPAPIFNVGPFGGSETIQWELMSLDVPIIVLDKNVSGVTLIQHTSTICGMCP